MIQVPVVTQSPVIFKTLIPIPGFFGSPHNLIEKLLDNASNLGSFSQVSSIDEKTLDGDVGGHHNCRIHNLDKKYNKVLAYKKLPLDKYRMVVLGMVLALGLLSER